jgi:hypothetical protein
MVWVSIVSEASGNGLPSSKKATLTIGYIPYIVIGFPVVHTRILT